MRNDCILDIGKFQSTLPVWGATYKRQVFVDAKNISIHTPRVGSDILIAVYINQIKPISIHTPRVGSDEQNISSQIPA